MVAVTEAPPLVVKFGGAAFAAEDAHRMLARYVGGRLRREGRRRAVVVVSAVAGRTDELRAMLHRVADAPGPDLTARTLMTGETLNTQLMTAALQGEGLDAVGITAQQTGFLATGAAHRAELSAVDPAVLRAAGRSAPVLVIPGGQALDERGEPVLMGRNSSDLSAVAAAIALDTGRCEIFSATPGVCRADPSIVPTARPLTSLDYRTAEFLSRSGARVLHHSAVRWAQRQAITLVCASLPPHAHPFTVISGGPHPAAAAVVVNKGARLIPVGAAEGEQRLRGLETLGVDALLFAADGQSYLAVDSQGDLDSAEAAALIGGRTDPSHCLLSVLAPDGTVTRQLVARGDADDAVREHHARLEAAPLGR